jgi:hypothetical protein
MESVQWSQCSTRASHTTENTAEGAHRRRACHWSSRQARADSRHSIERCAPPWHTVMSARWSWSCGTDITALPTQACMRAILSQQRKGANIGSAPWQGPQAGRRRPSARPAPPQPWRQSPAARCGCQWCAHLCVLCVSACMQGLGPRAVFSGLTNTLLISLVLVPHLSCSILTVLLSRSLFQELKPTHAVTGPLPPSRGLARPSWTSRCARFSLVGPSAHSSEPLFTHGQRHVQTATQTTQQRNVPTVMVANSRPLGTL